MTVLLSTLNTGDRLMWRSTGNGASLPACDCVFEVVSRGRFNYTLRCVKRDPSCEYQDVEGELSSWSPDAEVVSLRLRRILSERLES